MKLRSRLPRITTVSRPQKKVAGDGQRALSPGAVHYQHSRDDLWPDSCRDSIRGFTLEALGQTLHHPWPAQPYHPPSCSSQSGANRCNGVVGLVHESVVIASVLTDVCPELYHFSKTLRWIFSFCQTCWCQGQASYQPGCQTVWWR
jgi:hypothetical protein